MAALVGGEAACVHRNDGLSYGGGGGGASQDVSGYASNPVILRIENHNFADMDVFAIPPAGQLFRLGMATGVGGGTYKIPANYLATGSIGFVAIPIGGFGSAATGQLTPAPGDTVIFTIEQSLAQSSVTIR